jgi:hypothetical protein
MPGKNFQERVDNWWIKNGISPSGDRQDNGAASNYFEVSHDSVFEVTITPEPASPLSSSEDSTDSEIADAIQTARVTLESLQALAFIKKNQKFDGVQVPPRVGPPRDKAKTSSPTADKPVPKIIAHPPPPHIQSASENQEPSLSKKAGKAVDRSGNQSSDKPQGPMKPVDYPLKPTADAPKYHIHSSIEQGVDARKIAERALDAPVVLTHREVCAILPGVRKEMKEMLTGKRVATNFAEITSEDEEDFGIAACFDVQESREPAPPIKNQFSKYAKANVDLRVIYPTYAPGFEVESILDSGCEIIVMQQEIWEQIGAYLDPHKATRMNAANNTSSSTLGVQQLQPSFYKSYVT